MKVFDLEFDSDHYYIKRSRVVERITFGNRIFYSKFERINEPITPLLLQQHLNRHYTIAFPLLNKGNTNHLVIEYKGEDHQRFAALIQHLFHTEKIENFAIYQGQVKEKVQVFITVDALPIEEAESYLNTLSDKLKIRLTKRWKTLPSTLLPEAYNIVTLPYRKLS